MTTCNDPIIIPIPGDTSQPGLVELINGLIEANLESGNTKFLIDLHQVEFVESAFLGMLVVALRRVATGGGYIRLCRMNPHVLAVFQVMKLDQVFEIYGGVNAGIRSFNEAPTSLNPAGDLDARVSLQNPA